MINIAQYEDVNASDRQIGQTATLPVRQLSTLRRAVIHLSVCLFIALTVTTDSN